MRRPPAISEFHKYPVTGGTILLAVGVTLAWWGKVDITPLMEDIGVRRWQLWRLVTAVLPHINVMHLVFNCYWTWVFGTLIEETFGHALTLGIFLLLAVVSGAAEFAFLSGGVGLSGVGYGLFGMLWVLSTRDRRFDEAVDQNTVWLFVAWFFFCIVLTILGTPIGNIAHGAGTLAGALLGWSICERGQRRVGAIAMTVALTLASVAGATVARPWVNFSGMDEARAGYEALMAGRNEEAIRWYVDATRMKPREASYWYNLGIGYDRANDPHDAQRAWRKALSLDPDNKNYQELVERR